MLLIEESPALVQALLGFHSFSWEQIKALDQKLHPIELLHSQFYSMKKKIDMIPKCNILDYIANMFLNMLVLDWILQHARAQLPERWWQLQ